MAAIQNTSSLLIKRTAIDSSGRLGSLYDACQDRILETLIENLDTPSDQFRQTAQCILEKGDNNQNRNLLELINIDEQLRLSILLNLTQKNGIAAVIDQLHIIDEYTRVLHYSYVYREERFPDELQGVREWVKTAVPTVNATHIITGVSWGVDIVIILQLPSDVNMITTIDETLEKYRAFLNDDSLDFRLTRNDLDAYRNIISTKVYSNIPDLTKTTTLHGIFHNITRFKTDVTQHQRLAYTLYPLSNSTYVPLDSTMHSILEEYLYELSTSIKPIETYFNENMFNLLCGHLKERLTNTHKQWSDVKSDYISVIEEFAQLIIDIRSDQIQIFTLESRLKNEVLTILQNNVYDLTQNVTELSAKGHLIRDLGHQRIQYCNVVERRVHENDNEETLKRKLMIDENNDRILCSNDFLNEKDPAQLQRLCHTLVEELENNPTVRLTYADFSYSSFELRNMIILSSRNNNNKKRNSTSTPMSNSPLSFTKARFVVSPSPSKLSTADTVNILLLGETGVGKSTFINAFVNYLQFKTLDKAQSNKPIVAIPVSFPMTVGNDFEEHTISFGDSDNSHNEDFDHPGQSVTQHCQCHSYRLNGGVGRKLRIIDTPGFGDTRGLDQDDRNMQHILDYVKKLKYVNAICFLLKPNESRLSIFLQSCLTQLSNLLGPDFVDHIIFCFTNARSTFYTPGNTAPLLKDMLSSVSIRNVPFNKKNTYCFDSESFRYLVALQNEVSFSDLDKQEYEMSWKNSAAEASRLTRYICKKLTAYPIPDESEAIKCAHLEITQMIHQMIESMRYILRDIIVEKMNSEKLSIQPRLNGVDYNYEHTSDQSNLMEFLQDYKIVNSPLSEKQNDMIDQLLWLCDVSAEFGHFLVYMARSSQGDPFLAGLSRLIKEENNTGKKQHQKPANLQLVEGLEKLKSNYEQSVQNIKSNSKQRSVSDINESIKYMRNYPFISGDIVDSYQTTVRFDPKITTI
jgi:GTPase SAR1 family protein